MTTEILPTRVEEFIKQMMLWAHGRQIKAITKFVLAIIDKQTGNQAELARTQGNQIDLSIRQAQPHSALGRPWISRRRPVRIAR